MNDSTNLSDHLSPYGKMSPIKLQRTLSTPISMRLNNELLEKLDGVIIYLKKHYPDININRSQLIELLLNFACENASFKLDERILPFEAVYNGYKAQNVILEEFEESLED